MEQKNEQLNNSNQNSKNFWVAIGVSVLVTVVLVSGGAYWWQKSLAEIGQKELQSEINNLENQLAQKEEIQKDLRQQIDKLQNQITQLQQTRQEPEIDTSDWKVYRNEEYGFEVKYPGDFRVDEIDYSKDLMSSLLFVAKYYFVETIPGRKFKYGGPGYLLGVEKISERNVSNINEWVDYKREKIENIDSYEGAEIDPEIILTEDMEIQGKYAKKIQVKGYPYLDTEVGVIYNDYLYTLSYDGNIKESERVVIQSISDQKQKIVEFEKHWEKYRMLFDQILSTLKFI